MLKSFAAAVLAYVLLAAPVRADQQSLRDDALSLVGYGVLVPGIAAYCEKFIEHNEQLIDAASAWNKRHDALLRRVVAVVEWSGGMSGAQRKQIDRAATQLVREILGNQEDKPGYCRSVAVALDAGRFDIRNSDLAPAAERVMGAKLD